MFSPAPQPRKPAEIEHLYIDMDGFFASVEQAARPALRGRPVGVLPFSGTDRTICIAVSKEAKRAGVKTGTSVADARALCPEIAFQTQTPELYVRAHHALLAAIEHVTPIDGVCSIDEMTGPLDAVARRNPEAFGAAVKAAIRAELGPWITGSIGLAANRHLAKICSKWDKPDGLTILRPADMPGRLLDCPLEDVPGIGRRMERRLAAAGIADMAALWGAGPKQMRAIWGSVSGERLWYLLHGHDVPGEDTQRRMIGHSRVLPPSHRGLAEAQDYSTFLLTKAARRMRREGYRAGRLALWMGLVGRASWGGEESLPIVRDDAACLAGLSRLWARARAALPPRARAIQVGVTLMDLWSGDRQLDIFVADDPVRRKWEALTEAQDRINGKYDKLAVSVGPLRPPPGQYAGAKIAYTRIPDFRDFR